jgi:hypothetical protein
MDFIHYYYMQYINMFQNYPPSLQEALTSRREPNISQNYSLKSIRIVI